MALSNKTIRCVTPNSFDPVLHYYPRVLNAHANPLIRHFFNMSIQRIVLRYCHLNPHIDIQILTDILTKPAKHFLWAGCDLMHVTNAFGKRKMVIIETNSCPSGQKSMPLLDEEKEKNGYLELIQRVLKPAYRSKEKGSVAVLYDKNEMEASGYAATLADELQEDVWLIPFENDNEQLVQFDDGKLILFHEGQKIAIRFAFRYVTQKPWNRIPIQTKTSVLNPVICGLAGGRNKALAAKAYEMSNYSLERYGLRIQTPKTIWDVRHSEIPLWIENFGGNAVIKVPYSNAGQGVYTITSESELANFMVQEHKYDRYIVQSLIGHYKWSSGSNDKDRLFHVGTIPNNKGDIFVSDLRMMVCSGPMGWKPIAMYARRARDPITSEIPTDSWSVLGTNLSGKDDKGNWTTDSSRLLLMDERDFNRLGLSLDEIIEAFVQTVLAIQGIDNLADNLLNSKRKLKRKLFQAMCNDDVLMQELMI